MTVQVIKTDDAAHLVFNAFEDGEQVYSLTHTAFDLFIEALQKINSKPTGQQVLELDPSQTKLPPDDEPEERECEPMN